MYKTPVGTHITVYDKHGNNPVPAIIIDNDCCDYRVQFEDGSVREYTWYNCADAFVCDDDQSTLSIQN